LSGVLRLRSPSPPEARTWSSSSGPKHSCGTTSRVNAQTRSRAHQDPTGTTAPGGLAEVALVARRKQVVLRRGAASNDRHDVVDVQDDAGSVARATAVAAAEAVALQDAEAHLRGNGIAGSRDAVACRHARPVGRRVGTRPVPSLTRHIRGEGAAEGVLNDPRARRPTHPVQVRFAGSASRLALASPGCLRLTHLARAAETPARRLGRGSHGGTPSNGCTDREEPTPGEF
jgi:hypothetical protein